MKAVIVVAVVLAFVATAGAGPRKVVVLPIDGDAPAAQRTKLDATIAKLARKSGDVTIGDVTFNETAAAVGCMPDAPGCAANVLTTLGVDEIVYGTATTSGSSTTIKLKRAAIGKEPREHQAVVSDAAGAEAALAPAFDDTAVASAGPSDAGGSFLDTRDRKLAVGFAAGGLLALVVGFSQWAGKSGLQDQIDSHPKNTVADFQALSALEDRAGTKALVGNLCVGVGVALVGAGGYFWYRDRQHRNATTITPAPVESGTGATLLIGGRW